MDDVRDLRRRGINDGSTRITDGCWGDIQILREGEWLKIDSYQV